MSALRLRLLVASYALLFAGPVATGTGQAAQAPRSQSPAASPMVTANDNRIPAGVLKDGVLTLHLVATIARWQPEGQSETDPVRVIQAFAEEGKSPQIPGPLVRVPEGTEIRMTVRNALPGDPLRVYGAMSRPGDADAFVEIANGATREIRFTVGQPGTYAYLGSTSGKPLQFRFGNVDVTLAGAFIVDPAGGREEPNDRIFMLTEFLGALQPSGDVAASLAINGRSWPYTERQVLPFGQAATWRVINASATTHPMHLHGSFYTVESLGTYARDTIYDHDSRRLVTTEALAPATTMTMRWVPDRVGKWLFHCHLQGHVTGDMRAPDMSPAERHMAHGPHDIEHSMAGLVLGITVLPGDETAAPDLKQQMARHLTVTIDTLPNRYGADSGFGFTITDPEQPAAPSAPLGDAPPPPPNPSPTLVLQRGEPVAITLVNKTDTETSIHWHGIELESYNDGVAGWSGDTRQTTKPIPAGGTLSVWFTPPRAGTFIYHTHAHGPHQLSSGMYSALLVVPDRKAFNDEAEKVVLLGGSGPASADFGLAPMEVNRSTNPLPMTLKAGTKYRFRLIDISPNDIAIVSLRGETGPVQWRAVAKDGADLPPVQATSRAASQQIAVGETYDFEYMPTAPAELRLEVWKLDADVLTTERVHVTK
jgi:FtsP/CotA-like multicopper oxidase with cupredoxin domain